MHSEEILNSVYFTGPFGATGSALHSAVPPAGLLTLYIALGRWRRDRRKVVLWLLLGWLGHTVADFLTHADDARPLFWPISDWEWSSPISYYNPLYYGRAFSAVNHGLMLVLILWLIIRRIRRAGERKPMP